MGVRILEADVRKELSKFVSLLNENRTREAGIERFEWLYLGNPRGNARVWFAVDEKSGEEVAFTCALPRLVKVNGKDVICWNCGDFSVKRRYRTLGVAVKLRRAAREAVDHNDIQALYAHPNDRMKIIHDKVGHLRIGTMLRFARPLNIRDKLEGRVKNRMLVALLASPGNLLLDIYDRFVLKKGRGYDTLHVANARFTCEFDTLFRKVSPDYSIIGDRGSEYLNWRFFDNPLYKTRRLEVRKDGELRGYILFSIDGGVAIFRDMLCAREEPVAAMLLSQWVRLLKKERVSSLSVILMNHNPFIPVLRSIGFLLRPERSQVYAYAGKGSGISEEWTTGQNWYMTVGDRDV